MLLFGVNTGVCGTLWWGRRCLGTVAAVLACLAFSLAVSHAAVGVAALFPAGVDWTASYDELAKLDEGRHMAAFEGMPLEQVLGVDMSLAVSQQQQATCVLESVNVCGLRELAAGHHLCAIVWLCLNAWH
jgi:hypothetical protein